MTDTLVTVVVVALGEPKHLLTDFFLCLFHTKNRFVALHGCEAQVFGNTVGTIFPLIW